MIGNNKLDSSLENSLAEKNWAIINPRQNSTN